MAPGSNRSAGQLRDSSGQQSSQSEQRSGQHSEAVAVEAYNRRKPEVCESCGGRFATREARDAHHAASHSALQ